MDAQYRQRGVRSSWAASLVNCSPDPGCRQGVHQAVDLPHQRRQLLGLDGQVERAQVGGVPLADGLRQQVQRGQATGDQPPQQAEQEGQGDEEGSMVRVAILLASSPRSSSRSATMSQVCSSSL